MEAIEYIHKFKMTEPDFEFNRSRFIQEFSNDFRNYLDNDKIGLDANGKLTYQRFKQIVNNFQAKYKAISYIRASESSHGGLTKKLWGFFYSNVVLRERAIRFPDIHNFILNKRYEYNENRR